MSRMKFRIVLLGFGIVFLFAAYLAIVKGEIKWSPDQVLKGSQARLIGLGALVLGLIMIAAGVFYPHPLWEGIR
jgi:hypothetical protein